MTFTKFRPAPKLTKTDILNIARSKGSFHTSPRYRDSKLDSKCRELVGEGKLRRSKNFDKYDNREYEYVKPSPTPITSLAHKDAE